MPEEGCIFVEELDWLLAIRPPALPSPLTPTFREAELRCATLPVAAALASPLRRPCNNRAHALGASRKAVLNDGLAWQWRRTLQLLARTPSPPPQLRLASAVLLALQDRLEEAAAALETVLEGPAADVPEMQVAYLKAWLALADPRADLAAAAADARRFASDCQDAKWQVCRGFGFWGKGWGAVAVAAMASCIVVFPGVQGFVVVLDCNAVCTSGEMLRRACGSHGPNEAPWAGATASL